MANASGRSSTTPRSPSGRFRFEQYGSNRRRLREIVDMFRQKGATSPEKAMMIQELDLPPRFEEAMHRRLGRFRHFLLK